MPGHFSTVREFLSTALRRPPQGGRAKQSMVLGTEEERKGKGEYRQTPHWVLVRTQNKHEREEDIRRDTRYLSLPAYAQTCPALLPPSVSKKEKTDSFT